jgi:imidazolonepropionase-like amidohydrolase
MKETEKNKQRLLHAQGVYNTEKKAYWGNALVIDESRIIAVGDFHDLKSRYQAACVEDLGNCYLLPGLINTHVHLEFEAVPNTLDFFTAEDEYANFFRAAKHAETMLRSGVTTLRDAGSSWRLLSLNNPGLAQAAKLPRMQFSGPPVTITGGHLYFFGGEADSEDELVRAVREHHKRGCAALKLIVSGGQLTPGTLPERESYNTELIAAAVQEAHHLGMTSFAHCLTTNSMVNALRGGVQSIEHAACFVRHRNKLLERVYEEKIMEEFRGGGRWFMNGISNNYHALDNARENRSGASERELFLLEQEERECSIFKKYVELGFRAVIGTDAGVGLTYFDETWLECTILAERCGMSPADIIEAATVNGAACLGLEHETGKLAAGYSADIIALGEDPLKNITALKNPAKVICRGEDIPTTF